MQRTPILNDKMLHHTDDKQSNNNTIIINLVRSLNIFVEVFKFNVVSLVCFPPFLVSITEGFMLYSSLICSAKTVSSSYWISHCTVVDLQSTQHSEEV